MNDEDVFQKSMCSFTTDRRSEILIAMDINWDGIVETLTGAGTTMSRDHPEPNIAVVQQSSEPRSDIVECK